jgi:chromosome segregation ATPase
MTTTATHESFHDLATMILYMDAQCQKINALVTEIEEIQRAFETRFVDTRQKFENTKAQVAVWVEQHDWQQPDWLAVEITERLPKIEEQKRERLCELAKELGDLGTQRQEVEAQSQARIGALKDNNPRLNAREEELKAKEQAMQQALEAALAAWRASGRGIGWLVQPGKVQRLRKQAEVLADQLADVNARLTEVRNSWHTMETNTEANEASLQDAWRLRTAEIARLRREDHSLRSDMEGACREAALDEVLNAIAEAKAGGSPDFDALLASVVSLHDQVRDYENGIAQVAELMGIMKGVCEGLGRMKESVEGVKKEQDMHTELANLKLQAPATALQFHQLWDRLQPVVLDEKFAAEHPRDLAVRLKQTIGEGMTNAALDAMFTALGSELDRATKEQW